MLRNGDNVKLINNYGLEFDTFKTGDILQVEDITDYEITVVDNRGKYDYILTHTWTDYLKRL